MPDEARERIKKIGPVDRQGLDFSRPGPERMWSKLDNVIFHNGRIQTRPGLVPVGPANQDITNIGPGTPAVICQAEAYGEQLDAASLGGSELFTLVPVGTLNSGVTGWEIVGSAPAATHHESIDDTAAGGAPDEDVTAIEADTDGETVTLRYTSIGSNLDVVDGVTLYTRARALQTGEIATIIVKDGDGNERGRHELFNGPYTGFDDMEEEVTLAGYQDFYLPMAVRLVGSADVETPWSPTNIFDFRYELEISSADAFVLLHIDSIGNDNDFGATGTTNLDLSDPLVYMGAADEVASEEGENGERLSVVFNAPDITFGTVSSVELTIGAAVERAQLGAAAVQMYHRGTDTVRRDVGDEHSIVSQVFVSPDAGGATNNWSSLYALSDVKRSGELTTNPETSAAWTNAQLQAGLEFGVKVESIASGNKFQLNGVELTVKGTTGASGQGARITASAVLVSGRSFASGTGGTGAGVFAGSTSATILGRLMGTHTGFQRLDDDIDDDGLTDVATGGSNYTVPTAPPWDWDWTEFFGKLYFVNGRDELYQYWDTTATPDDDLVEQLDSINVVGTTVWTFGNRIMMGDIIESGTRDEKRVRWSALADAFDWTAASSGNLNLTHGGQGRLRKGLPLSSHIAALYLDRGIYNLRWTGDDSFPFAPKIVDHDTGIVAPNTCLATIDGGGSSVHIFLGDGPDGLNVYAYDGQQASPIGNEIRSELKRLNNFSVMRHAFAGIEPTKNLYCLFIAEGIQMYPEQCWVYHIGNGHWTRWTLPSPVTCAGQWKLINDADDPDGEVFLILGNQNGLPFYFDELERVDVTNIGREGNTNKWFETIDITEDNGYADAETPILVDIETGDIPLSEENNTRNSTLKRVSLTHDNISRLTYTLDESRDGGINFSNSQDILVGATNNDELLQHQVELTPQSGRYHRVRIKANADELSDGSTSTRQKISLIDINLHYEEQGDLP